MVDITMHAQDRAAQSAAQSVKTTTSSNVQNQLLEDHNGSEKIIGVGEIPKHSNPPSFLLEQG
jgi:hypothetical protein